MVIRMIRNREIKKPTYVILKVVQTRKKKLPITPVRMYAVNSQGLLSLEGWRGVILVEVAFTVVLG